MSLPTVRRRSASSVGSADRRAAEDLTAGFTLVEVLVAFAILSMVLIGLFSGISTALRGDYQAAFTRSALLLATADLETEGLVVPLAPGVTTGRFENGMEWRRTVRPYISASGSANGPASAYWVEMVVRPPSGFSQPSFASTIASHLSLTPSVTLTTLKLVGTLR
jgi:prepilin-type N-terminal cleavage/methylation domain-containing protein